MAISFVRLIRVCPQAKATDVRNLLAELGAPPHVHEFYNQALEGAVGNDVDTDDEE